MITLEYLNKSTHPSGSGRHMATTTPLRDYRILQLHVNDLKKKVFKLGVSTLKPSRCTHAHQHPPWRLHDVACYYLLHRSWHAACCMFSLRFHLCRSIHGAHAQPLSYFRDSTTIETYIVNRKVKLFLPRNVHKLFAALK